MFFLIRGSELGRRDPLAVELVGREAVVRENSPLVDQAEHLFSAVRAVLLALDIEIPLEALHASTV